MSVVLMVAFDEPLFVTMILNVYEVEPLVAELHSIVADKPEAVKDWLSI